MAFRLSTVAAVAATVSLIGTPVAAAEFPRVASANSVSASAIFDPATVNADNHRRWRGRDRVDAGDVIAGVLVLGTIAAVASAASKAKREREVRGPYPYPDRPYDYRSGSTDGRFGDSHGIDRAVDMCAREIERNAAIDTVEAVERTGTGWHVSGRLTGGSPFSCSIGNDGRIEGVDYGRQAAVNDNQWDDQRYAAARAAQDGGAPAYPGGPTGAESSDGRYETAQAPDFPG